MPGTATVRPAGVLGTGPAVAQRPEPSSAEVVMGRPGLHSCSSAGFIHQADQPPTSGLRRGVWFGEKTSTKKQFHKIKCTYLFQDDKCILCKAVPGQSHGCGLHAPSWAACREAASQALGAGGRYRGDLSTSGPTVQAGPWAQGGRRPSWLHLLGVYAPSSGHFT